MKILEPKPYLQVIWKQAATSVVISTIAICLCCTSAKVYQNFHTICLIYIKYKFIKLQIIRRPTTAQPSMPAIFLGDDLELSDDSE